MSSVNFLINKTLGKYEVLEHIGHGGMAEVYKGQHVQLDRMVAVKVLHPFLADEEGFVIRFKREARIVATLRHPNIMQVFDFDYNEELAIYYMVMEYIDGPTLKTRLQDEQISPEDTARFGASMADALDYAHQRGMVHRDIKPANIMFITSDQPVLTDFGIAKMLTLSGLTASGAMVGTPAYMAPEVGMGKAGIAASDMYSLGVVLYQMVTGELPFQSESPMGMVMQHINDTPKPPSQLSSISPELDAVIMRALAKQPEARFSRAAEMGMALRQAIGLDTPTGTSPLLAAPETPPPAPARPASSRVDTDNDRLLRTWPATSGGLTTSTTTRPGAQKKEAVVDTPDWLTADDDAPATDETASRPSRVRRVALALGVLLILIISGAAAWIGFGGAIPAEVWDRLPPQIAAQWPQGQPTLSPTPSDTPTPLPPTATPQPRATATPEEDSVPLPLVTETAMACNEKLKLSRIQLSPADVVQPGASVMAHITLQNNGDCPWPDELRMDFVSGEQMQAPDMLPLASIAAGETTQVRLSLLAPTEPEVYTAQWEARRADGSQLGDSIVIRLEVSDTLTLAPTPTAVSVAATETPLVAALTLSVSNVIEWADIPSSDTWQGVVVLTATGGTGEYRYYWQDIRAETYLPEGELHFTAPRCAPFSLQLWALSGAETVRWEGTLPYPAPDTCP